MSIRPSPPLPDLHRGEGLLAIWHDVAPGYEPLVRDWYNQEHHAERLEVPGFLSAHRYERATGAGAAIMSLYRTSTPDVLWSSGYRERLQNPSERTRAVMPAYRNMCRTVCRLDWSAGVADGGALAVLAITDDDRKSSGAQREFLSSSLQAASAMPGVLRCRWIVRVALPEPDASSAERDLRSGLDREIGWALLVDADCGQRAVDALATMEERMAEHFGPLAADDPRVRQRACYRLVYSSYRQ